MSKWDFVRIRIKLSSILIMFLTHYDLCIHFTPFPPKNTWWALLCHYIFKFLIWQDAQLLNQRLIGIASGVGEGTVAKRRPKMKCNDLFHCLFTCFLFLLWLWLRLATECSDLHVKIMDPPPHLILKICLLDFVFFFWIGACVSAVHQLYINNDLYCNCPLPCE